MASSRRLFFVPLSIIVIFSTLFLVFFREENEILLLDSIRCEINVNNRILPIYKAVSNAFLPAIGNNQTENQRNPTLDSRSHKYKASHVI